MYGIGWGGWPAGYRTMAIGSTVSGGRGGGSVENERARVVVVAVAAVVEATLVTVAAEDVVGVAVATAVGGSGEAMGILVAGDFGEEWVLILKS